jgi:hypothetical protein
MSQQFENIRESLLRGGVAPRHVARYTRELRDHFDDLVREERANGGSAELAEVNARRRLGSDDVLIGAVLARPELRSVIARHPMAFFGVGPVATLIAAIVFAVFLEHEFVVAHLRLTDWLRTTNAIPQGGTLPPMWVRTSVAWWNWAVTYAAPVAIAAAICVVGTRQRMPLRWIVAGAAVASTFGAFHFVDATWTNIPYQSRLAVSYIGPGYTRHMVLFCFARLAVNLFLLSLAYWFWLRNAHPLANPSPNEMSA